MIHQLLIRHHSPLGIVCPCIMTSLVVINEAVPQHLQVVTSYTQLEMPVWTAYSDNHCNTPFWNLHKYMLYVTFNRYYGCHCKRRTSKIVVTHCKRETFHALQGERSDADLVLACFQYMMGSWHDSLCKCSNTIYLITIYMYMIVWASDVTYTILFSQSYSFIFSHL